MDLDDEYLAGQDAAWRSFSIAMIVFALVVLVTAMVVLLAFPDFFADRILERIDF